ncbi:MAG: Csu type fimbrial protein [Gammaproteobacteria bacterium]
MLKFARTLIATSAGILLIAIGTQANAATVPGGTFTVTATVAASCKTAAANNIAFGSLDPSSIVADTYLSNSIKVQCTKKTPFTVLMDAGTNPGTAGNVATRQMKDAAGDFLPYHLCTVNPCTGDIANVTPATGGNVNLAGTGTGTGSGNAVTLNFFGEVALTDLQLAVASASYTDTITVTISY